MNDTLNQYKADLFDVIIDENERLIVESPSNSITIWNLVNAITSQMWATFDFYINTLDLPSKATYKLPTAKYIILENQIICVLLLADKRLTVQYTHGYEPTYFGINKSDTRNTILGKMNFGATPHILAWLVS